MIYRQISIARVMRKIALNDYSDIYFQVDDGSKDLLQLERFKWKLEKFKQHEFFELEGLNPSHMRSNQNLKKKAN